MDLKIFGYSCRLEIIIVCLIVGFVLGGHLLCSCSRVGIQEGMAVMGASLDWSMGGDVANSWTNKADKYSHGMEYSSAQSKWSQYKGTPVPLPEHFFKIINFAIPVVKNNWWFFRTLTPSDVLNTVFTAPIPNTVRSW